MWRHGQAVFVIATAIGFFFFFFYPVVSVHFIFCSRFVLLKLPYFIEYKQVIEQCSGSLKHIDIDVRDPHQINMQKQHLKIISDNTRGILRTTGAILGLFVPFWIHFIILNSKMAMLKNIQQQKNQGAYSKAKQNIFTWPTFWGTFCVTLSISKQISRPKESAFIRIVDPTSGITVFEVDAKIRSMVTFKLNSLDFVPPRDALFSGASAQTKQYQLQLDGGVAINSGGCGTPPAEWQVDVTGRQISNIVGRIPHFVSWNISTYQLV